MKPVFALFFLLSIIGSRAAFAQSNAESDSTKRPSIVLGFHADFLPSASAPDFFSVYGKTLGGKVTDFPIMSGVGTTIAVDISRALYVLLQLQAVSLSFSDAGMIEAKDTAGNVVSTASSLESWSSQTYPIQAGIRYAPVVSQFESYGFFLVGAAVSHVRWDYTTVSASNINTYPANATFEQTKVSPSFALGAGLELRFDQFRDHENDLLRGLMLEVCYRWAHASYAAFQPMAAGSITPFPQWNDSYNVNLDGLEIHVGVNFELSH
ncbi:MAG TPA: hypothetical protein VFA55_08565 [Candidatus Kapabacteria bacterium]|nr:hypothetical protein [Candidatus Kapabacteria bacterium]